MGKKTILLIVILAFTVILMPSASSEMCYGSASCYSMTDLETCYIVDFDHGICSYNVEDYNSCGSYTTQWDCESGGGWPDCSWEYDYTTYSYYCTPESCTTYSSADTCNADYDCVWVPGDGESSAEYNWQSGSCRGGGASCYSGNSDCELIGNDQTLCGDVSGCSWTDGCVDNSDCYGSQEECVGTAYDCSGIGKRINPTMTFLEDAEHWGVEEWFSPEAENYWSTGIHYYLDDHTRHNCDQCGDSTRRSAKVTYTGLSGENMYQWEAFFCWCPQFCLAGNKCEFRELTYVDPVPALNSCSEYGTSSSCESGFGCDWDPDFGICECQPDCSGKTCGSDGCGNTWGCGTCDGECESCSGGGCIDDNSKCPGSYNCNNGGCDYCGDEITNGDEECDDGPDGSASCTSSCTTIACKTAGQLCNSHSDCCEASECDYDLHSDGSTNWNSVKRCHSTDNKCVIDATGSEASINQRGCVDGDYNGNKNDAFRTCYAKTGQSTPQVDWGAVGCPTGTDSSGNCECGTHSQYNADAKCLADPGKYCNNLGGCSIEHDNIINDGASPKESTCGTCKYCDGAGDFTCDSVASGTDNYNDCSVSTCQIEASLCVASTGYGYRYPGLCDGSGGCIDCGSDSYWDGDSCELVETGPCATDAYCAQTGDCKICSSGKCVFAGEGTDPNGLCSDGNWCNGVETCGGSSSCVDGTAPDCADSNDCTSDSCNEASDSCTHTTNCALASCTKGGTDYCNECSHCGDSSLNCGENCDGSSFSSSYNSCTDSANGGFDGGSVSCNSDCTVNTSSCWNDACSSGTCCNTGANPNTYYSTSTICDSSYSTTTSCYNNDVYNYYKRRYCPGDTTSCSGSISGWIRGTRVEDCSTMGCQADSCTGVTTYNDYPSSCSRTCFSSTCQDCTCSASSSGTCSSSMNCDTATCSGSTIKCHYDSGWEWDTSANVGSTTEDCTDGYDNDCETSGEKDYDGKRPDGTYDSKGDSQCPVGVTAASLSTTDYCPGDTVTLRCTSTYATARSIEASMTSTTCTFDSWDGSDALFSCTISGSASGTLTATCGIDTSKSYQSGTDKTDTITQKAAASCCSTYDTQTDCQTASCTWIPSTSMCSSKKYFAPADPDGACIEGSATYVCDDTKCSAECDTGTPSTCAGGTDTCSGTGESREYKDYSSYSRSCQDDCTWSNACDQDESHVTSYTAASCSTTYQTNCNVCGDNCQAGTESCDDGNSNTDTPCDAAYDSTCNYCDTSCNTQAVTGPYCGDGSWDSGNEECEGSTNCRTDGSCTCADGYVGDGSGNCVEGDACTSGDCCDTSADPNIYRLSSYVCSGSTSWSCTGDSLSRTRTYAYCTGSTETCPSTTTDTVSCGTESCTDSCTGVTTYNDFPASCTNTCSGGTCDTCTCTATSSGTCSSGTQCSDATCGGSTIECHYDGGWVWDTSANVDATTEDCTDGYDNDCETSGEKDYDGQRPDGTYDSKGDSQCPVGVTAASLSTTDYCPGDTVTLRCTSTYATARSIEASMTSSTCTHTGWDGSDALFSCTIGTGASGTLTATCGIDTSKSYQSGTDKTDTVTQKAESMCCGAHDNQGDCETASCTWVPSTEMCSVTEPTKYFAPADPNGACITGSPTYVCNDAKCSAECDTGTPSTCSGGTDICSGTGVSRVFKDYSSYSKECQDDCSWNFNCDSTNDETNMIEYGPSTTEYQNAGCNECGDGVKYSSEECDGSDLGGATCVSEGYASGTLACSGCSYDYSSCSNDLCTSGDCCDTSADPTEFRLDTYLCSGSSSWSCTGDSLSRTRTYAYCTGSSENCPSTTTETVSCGTETCTDSCLGVTTYYEYPGSCQNTCSGGTCDTCTCTATSSGTCSYSGECGNIHSCDGNNIQCHYDGGWVWDNSATIDSTQEDTPAECSDGYDNDCDDHLDFGGRDYDGRDYDGDYVDDDGNPRTGDPNCPVEVTAATLSQSVYCPYDSLELRCTTPTAGIRSITASITQGSCVYNSWDGNDAVFICTVDSSATGTITATCGIDETRSYQTGTDKTDTMTESSSCCSSNLNSGDCSADGCHWETDYCTNLKYFEPAYPGGVCMELDNAKYVCDTSGHCGQECDTESTTGCLGGTDECVQNGLLSTFKDYSAYPRSCQEDCTWTTECSVANDEANMVEYDTSTTEYISAGCNFCGDGLVAGIESCDTNPDTCPGGTTGCEGTGLSRVYKEYTPYTRDCSGGCAWLNDCDRDDTFSTTYLPTDLEYETAGCNICGDGARLESEECDTVDNCNPATCMCDDGFIPGSGNVCLQSCGDGYCDPTLNEDEWVCPEDCFTSGCYDGLWYKTYANVDDSPDCNYMSNTTAYFMEFLDDDGCVDKSTGEVCCVDPNDCSGDTPSYVIMTVNPPN